MSKRKSQEQEEWRVCKECNNYAVSNLGRVKRVGISGGAKVGRIMASKLNNKGKGNRTVALSKNNIVKRYRVIDLIESAFFVDRPGDIIDIECKNRDRRNCKLSNIKYIYLKDIEFKGEVWRVIAKYPNYAVSNFGRVKRIKPGRSTNVGRILKLNVYKHSYGYLVVNLGLGSRANIASKVFVHTLVADAFLKKPTKIVVNHKDGNKLNNNIDNLEYCTNVENTSHAHRIGLIKAKGENNSQAKLSENDVIEIKELLKSRKKTKIKYRDIAKIFGVSIGAIEGISYNRSWKHLS
jgi:hypothetical protein